MDRPRISALAHALAALGVVLAVAIGGGSAAHAQDDNCVEVLPGVFDCSGSTTTVAPTTTAAPPTTAPPTTAPPTTAPPTTAPPTTAPPATAPPTTAPPATSPPATEPPATAPPATSPPTTAAQSPTVPSTTEAETPSISDQDINRSEAGRIDVGEAPGSDGSDPDAGDGSSDVVTDAEVGGDANVPAGEDDGEGLERADLTGEVAARDLDGGNNGLLFLIAPIAAGLVIVAAVATWTVLQGAAANEREPVGAGAAAGHAPAFDD